MKIVRQVPIISNPEIKVRRQLAASGQLKKLLILNVGMEGAIIFQIRNT